MGRSFSAMESSVDRGTLQALSGKGVFAASAGVSKSRVEMRASQE